MLVTGFKIYHLVAARNCEIMEILIHSEGIMAIYFVAPLLLWLYDREPSGHNYPLIPEDFIVYLIPTMPIIYGQYQYHI